LGSQGFYPLFGEGAGTKILGEIQTELKLTMLLVVPFATSSMQISIEFQDQNGNWHHYQSKQNQADAYRVAQRRAESTKKRHRLVDAHGRLLDLLDP